MGLLTLYLLAGIVLVSWARYNLSAKGFSFLIPLRLLVAIHATYIGMEWIKMGPMTKSHILQGMVLSLALMYLISLRRRDSQGLLVIIYPILVLGLVCSVVVSAENVLREEVSEHVRSIFLHILLALMGYASFFMVTMCSFLYLIQSRLLKVNSNSVWLSRVPSLLELTEIKWRALIFGLFFFSLAIGLGKLSPYLWDVPHQWGPKEVLSVMTWALYLVLFVAKRYFLQRKEMFAYVSLVGCILLILTLVVLNFDVFSMEELGN